MSYPPLDEVVFYSTPLLAQARKEIKISQRELCELIEATTEIKYGQDYYSRIETGRSWIKQEAAVEVARILKYPINELFTKERPHVKAKRKR